jgi:hypothetical protein
MAFASMERNTPKALANFSPGLLQPWAEEVKDQKTLKALGRAR